MTDDPTRRRTLNGAFGTTDVVRSLAGDDWTEARACERTVNYWRMNGAVVPSIRHAAGSGSWVRWSRDDLERLHRIWALRQQMRSYNMNLSLTVVREMWQQGIALTLEAGRPPLVSLNP